MLAADHQAPNNDREQTSPDKSDTEYAIQAAIMGKACLKRKVNLEQ